MKKKQKDNPIAYETEYYEYEAIENDYEESDTDTSDLESDISDKNDQEVILKEVEEMNNKYSFINVQSKKKKESTLKLEKKEELLEETYLSD